MAVEHLTKRFGDRVAFEDVSFRVGYGDVFGFLGPNGAGKTTTVRTLGTLLAPTSGAATVAGIELRPENGPAIRSRISVMPESPGLYLRLTVAENLECFARLYGLDDRYERIERALRAVNLFDRANDLCRSLSKGLRQRAALARALLSDPAVLFLDEPTSGLDPVATKEVHELIATLKDRGVTIFLTPTASTRPSGSVTASPSSTPPCASWAGPTSFVPRCSRAASRSGCAPTSPIPLPCSPERPEVDRLGGGAVRLVPA